MPASRPGPASRSGRVQRLVTHVAARRAVEQYLAARDVDGRPVQAGGGQAGRSPARTSSPRSSPRPRTPIECPAPRQIVPLALASANRGPASYERPAKLHLGRGDDSGLAFGHGIHHCLGSQLARVEGEIAFRAVLERLPRRPWPGNPDDLIWHNSVLLMGLPGSPSGWPADSRHPACHPSGSDRRIHRPAREQPPPTNASALGSAAAGCLVRRGIDISGGGRRRGSAD
jgi:hypothetical protein